MTTKSLSVGDRVRWFGQESRLVEIRRDEMRRHTLVFHRVDRCPRCGQIVNFGHTDFAHET